MVILLKRGEIFLNDRRLDGLTDNVPAANATRRAASYREQIFAK
jgi:hypothetical protein